jgi:hypothetical protein
MKYIWTTLAMTAAVLCMVSAAAADFDSRYWEKYAEISLPADGNLPAFGRINLYNNGGPEQNLSGIRIVTRSKREMPYQIVTRRPDSRTTEIQAKVVNLSSTPDQDTTFEGVLADKAVTYNAVEIVSDSQKFFRQVQIFGGADGVTWYRIRTDAVIFDYSDDKPVRHTKITIPDTRYRHLKVIINNRQQQPLKITGLKLFYDRRDSGLEETVPAQIKKQDIDAPNKTSSAEVELKYPTAFVGLNIVTSDKNFYRNVDVYVKRDSEQWVKWGSDFIFNFEGDAMMESKSVISVPEVTTRDVRLVIRNMDSPPLKISDVSAVSYQKTVVFKIDGRDNYFLFWGNSAAKAPTYDIASHISRQNIDSIRVFGLEPEKSNPDYVGSDKAKPFTERYKWLLYLLVGLVIAGLGYYQYRVIKKTGEE